MKPVNDKTDVPNMKERLERTAEIGINGKNDRAPLVDDTKAFGRKGWKIFKKIGIGYLIFIGVIIALVIGIMIFTFTQFFSMRNTTQDRKEAEKEFICTSAKSNLKFAERVAKSKENLYNSISDETESAKALVLQDWENAKEDLVEAQTEVDKVCEK